MRQQERRRIAVIAGGWLLINGCGSGPAGAGGTFTPWDGGPDLGHLDGGQPTAAHVNIVPSSLTLSVRESVAVKAVVSGGTAPTVVWDQESENGTVLALAPSGSSVTITALANGTTYLYASVPGTADLCMVKIPPLPFANGCTDDSECAADAPICRSSHVYCGKTCTRPCSVDADCPGGRFTCNVDLKVCRAIQDFDLYCP